MKPGGPAHDRGQLVGPDRHSRRRTQDPDRFLTHLREASRRLASAVTVYEPGIVIGARRGWESVTELHHALEQLGIEIVPFSEPHLMGALDAYRSAGKGVIRKRGSISAIHAPMPWPSP